MENVENVNQRASEGEKFGLLLELQEDAYKGVLATHSKPAPIVNNPLE